VQNCVVTRQYKPAVVLFVEVANEREHGDLKQEIMHRTAEFNSRLYKHERINDLAQIVVVKAGSLPRTKVCSHR
jgi:hypothetical protein